MCIDSNKRLPLLLATAIVGMVNICNAVPAVGAPMPADSNAVSFVGISRDAEGAYAVDVGDGTYGFAGLTAETGFGIAAGVAVGLHGSDVALAGYYTMVNGLPQDTLTSQGLQAVGVPQDWANGIDAGVSVAGTMGVGAAARTAGRVVVATPYGNAIQSSSHAALDSLSNVRNGSTVYRTGTLGMQNISEGQFWTLKNPLATSGYAEQYGLPTASQGYKFVVGGTIKNSARVVTREAPGLGANAGGAIEVVTPPNGVMLNWFHMP